MAKSLISPVDDESPLTPGRDAGIFRVRFVETTSGDQNVIQAFNRPRRVFAVEEPNTRMAPSSSSAASGEAVGACVVACLPKAATAEARQRARSLMGTVAASSTESPIEVGQEQETIAWQPERTLLQGRNDRIDDMLIAAVAFTFYEGELRAMERALEPLEAQAQTDVTLAHQIRRRDRRHWRRMRATMETLSTMRLAFARLEPLFGGGARELPGDARDWISRLAEESDIFDRLEAVSDRLETLEELYEGANQRISEYRWYREGHFLEIGIIFILLLECALMTGDLYWHFHEHADGKITDGR